MSEDIKGAIQQWEREKLLRRKLKKQENLLTTLQTEVLQLKNQLSQNASEKKSEEGESNESQPSEAATEAQPLLIETQVVPEVKTGLAGFWERLQQKKTRQKEARLVASGKRPHPSQKPQEQEKLV